MTDAPGSAKRKRLLSWEGVALSVLFGMGLLLWPFLAFGAIFIFDSPIQSREDWLSRVTVAYCIWFYPLTYFATFGIYLALRLCGVWRLLSCQAWILPVVAYFLVQAIAASPDLEEADPKRIEILYRTDHAAVLAACREVMANRLSYRLAEEKESDRLVIDPTDPKLPAVIRALKPTSVITDDENSLYMQLHRGSDDFGLDAASETHASSANLSRRDELVLIPGLTYFERGLTYGDGMVYRERLRHLKPDDAPEPTW